MNERIKALMIEAEYAAPEIAKRAHVLAELIVWECAMVASTETSDDGVGEVIKEHFGIKE